MTTLAHSLKWVQFILIVCFPITRCIRRVQSRCFSGWCDFGDHGLVSTELNDSLASITDRSVEEASRQLLSLRGFGLSGSTIGTESDPAEHHRVYHLPGLSSSEVLHQYAGHIIIDEAKSSSIFYWLFLADKDADSKPLLVWLNGGPGCSSMDGLFLELGPLKLSMDRGKTQITINPHSWHRAANLLFIDQPVGTGLSFTKSKSGYAKNDEMINQQFYTFMQKFFRLHPRFMMKDVSTGRRATKPFFMSGESHAGHYIATIATYIKKKNENSGTGDAKISLEGIVLGNPWIDPFNQYDVSDFAHGLGIISQGQRNKLKEMERGCRAQLQSGKLNSRLCFSLLDLVVDGTTITGNQKLLMYDARKFVPRTTVFPPGHDAVEAYLNRRDVREAIHSASTPHRFMECANPPFNALSHQDGKGVMRELANLLDGGMRVLVFAGQYDVICNHLGLERALNEMKWRGQQNWLKSDSGVWIQNKKPVGYIRRHENLQFLIVLGSGHMVPLDQPQISLSMINRFIYSQGYRSGPSKVGISTVSPADGSHCPTVLGSKNTFDDHTNSIHKSRILTANRQESAASSLHLVIGHATPLDAAVHLRLKVQHPSVAHHHIHQNKHLTPNAIQVLRQKEYVIYVEPDGIRVPIDLDSFEENRWAFSDLQIEGLRNGKAYTFSVIHAAETLSPSADSHSRRTSVQLKVGCFSPKITQCCGRGDCAPLSYIGNSNIAQCVCDTGYSGLFCDYYEVTVGNGVTANMSGAEQLCPVHAFHAHNISGRMRTINLSTVIASTSEIDGQERNGLIYCSDPHTCDIDLELRLVQRSSSMWLMPDQIDHYAQHVVGAMINDIRLSIDNLMSIKVHVSMGRRKVTSSDRIITSSAGHRVVDQQQSQSRTASDHSLMTVHFNGESKQVSNAIAAILWQLRTHSSRLRGGLVSSHLQHDYFLAVETVARSVYTPIFPSDEQHLTDTARGPAVSSKVVAVFNDLSTVWCGTTPSQRCVISLIIFAICCVLLLAFLTYSKCNAISRIKTQQNVD